MLDLSVHFNWICVLDETMLAEREVGAAGTAKSVRGSSVAMIGRRWFSILPARGPGIRREINFRIIACLSILYEHCPPRKKRWTNHPQDTLARPESTRNADVTKD